MSAVAASGLTALLPQGDAKLGRGLQVSQNLKEIQQQKQKQEQEQEQGGAPIDGDELRNAKKDFASSIFEFFGCTFFFKF